MTIKELIEILEDLPQDSIVVMSKDEEGNGFSPVDAVEECLYVAETSWSGEVLSADNYGEEGREKGREETPAACIWPVN